MSARRLASLAVQVAVLAVAGYFLAKAVVDGSADMAEALQAPDPGYLATLLAAAVAAMVWIAFLWVVILRRLGSPVAPLRGIGLYFVGEATKYLPGAFWPVIGRGELAVRAGARRADAYTSVLLSLVFNFILAGLLAAGALAPFALFGQVGTLTPLWLLVILPLGIGGLHPRLVGAAVRLAERVTGKSLDIPILPWRASVSLVVAYLPAWAAIGLATWSAARLVDARVDLALLLFASYLAWVAGFLAIPAPTGLGVREAVFAAIVSTLVTAGTASAIALIARIAFVFADAGGALAGLLALRGLAGAGERSRSETASEVIT